MNENPLEPTPETRVEVVGEPPSIDPGLRRGLSARALAALAVAVAADGLQLAFIPWFVTGGFGIAAGILDVIVAIVLTKLIGWNLAFVPSFLVEILPIVDLFLTWTGAVVFVMFRKQRQPEG